MIIALAHSFVRRSRYNHSGAPEAVKFRHKQNIAQQSCSCLIQTPLPWFCLCTQLRPGSKSRFYTQSQSHFLHVSSATFKSLENELKTTETMRLFPPLLLEMTQMTRQLDLSQCFLIDGRLTASWDDYSLDWLGFVMGLFLVAHPPPPPTPPPNHSSTPTATPLCSAEWQHNIWKSFLWHQEEEKKWGQSVRVWRWRLRSSAFANCFLNILIQLPF